MRIKAYTLAEIMITLVVIGLLSAVLLPIGVKSMPNKDLIKFKKGNSALYEAVNKLLSNNDYYFDNDLGIGSDGKLVLENGKLCQTFSDVMNVKTANCTGTDVSNITSLDSSKILSLDTAATGNNSTFQSIDCVCKQYSSNTPQITLSDGVSFEIIQPGITFGSYYSDKYTHELDERYRIFNPNATTKRYKYICMRIVGSSEDPFGYALSQNGKIMPGYRARIWNEANIQNNDIPDAGTTSTSCTSKTSYTISTAVSGYEWCHQGNGFLKIRTNLGSGVKEYCMTQFNVGDGPTGSGYNYTTVKSSATFVTAGNNCDDVKCCWMASSTKHTSATCTNTKVSKYSGCDRTVCNYKAGESICSAITIQGNTGFRLPTIYELQRIDPQYYSANRNSTGLMLCDMDSTNNDNQCKSSSNDMCSGDGNDDSNHTCSPSYIISSTKTNSKFNRVMYKSTSFKTSQNKEIYPYSIRCIKEL